MKLLVLFNNTSSFSRSLSWLRTCHQLWNLSNATLLHLLQYIYGLDLVYLSLSPFCNAHVCLLSAHTFYILSPPSMACGNIFCTFNCQLSSLTCIKLHWVPFSAWTLFWSDSCWTMLTHILCSCDVVLYIVQHLMMVLTLDRIMTSP